MKLQALTILAVLAASSSQAQEAPVNSPAYHAVHNPQSPYYVGPKQQQPAVQQPPQPAGYWEKTWGAIAPSPVGGVLGTALGASSKEEAERLALEDCKAKGGGACEVEMAYHNQCAVMTVGDEFLGSASAGSIERAQEIGLAACRERDTNCSIYYSACTEPIFHHY